MEITYLNGKALAKLIDLLPVGDRGTPKSVQHQDAGNTIGAAVTLGFHVQAAAFDKTLGQFLGLVLDDASHQLLGSAPLFAPLRDDGHADLLVKQLGLTVRDGKYYMSAWNDMLCFASPNMPGIDQAAATRRAVTGAAGDYFRRIRAARESIAGPAGAGQRTKENGAG